MNTNKLEQQLDTYIKSNNYNDKLFINKINQDIIDLTKLKSLKSVHFSYCTFDSIIFDSKELESIQICSCIIGSNLKLPDNLKSLSFHDSKYKTSQYIGLLDNLPPKLKTLHLEYCVETTLDNLPNSLKVLYIFTTKFKSLDYLPSGLKILHCWQNKYLEKLTFLPSGLEKLIFDENLKNIDEISINNPNLILEYCELPIGNSHSDILSDDDD